MVFKMWNKKFRLLAPVALVSTSTVLMAASCGSQNNSSVFIYGDLKTSVDTFYKNIYHKWQDKNDNKGFVAFYDDKTNNFHNRYALLYQVSIMTGYPDKSLTSYIVQQIQNNKNFFDATNAWNVAGFAQLIANSVLRYFTLFYLTALSYLHQKNDALNDLNASKLGKTSAVCEYLIYLQQSKLISQSDFNFWLLQLRDFFNYTDSAYGLLKGFVTSQFSNFTITLPTLSSADQPMQTTPFTYNFDVNLQGKQAQFINNIAYDDATKTYSNTNTQVNFANESKPSTQSNLPPGLKTRAAAASLWSDFQTKKAAAKDPSSYNFANFLADPTVDTQFTTYAKSLFGSDFSTFEAKITSEVNNSKNFTFSGAATSGWSSTQKGYLATALVNQMLWWARTAIIMVLCYQYDRTDTLSAAKAANLQSNSIYGAYFLYAINQKVFTTNNAKSNLVGNLRTLFSTDLITIFSSNDFSKLKNKNFLFYLIVTNNLQNVTISARQPITIAYANNAKLANFGLTIAFDNITIQYQSDFALTTNAVNWEGITNFVTSKK